MKLQRQYHQLENAASILGCSADDLVHHAGHGKLRLHVQLPLRYYAHPCWYAKDDLFGEKNNICDPEKTPMGFPIAEPCDIPAWIWKDYERDAGTAKIHHLSADYDKCNEFQIPPDGFYFGGWQILDGDWKPCDVYISVCRIVVMNSEIERILSQCSVKPAPTPTDKSNLGTIAALLAAWPGGKLPSGKELEKSAASVGVAITDDTIRKALSAARAIAKDLPPA